MVDTVCDAIFEDDVYFGMVIMEMAGKAHSILNNPGSMKLWY